MSLTTSPLYESFDNTGCTYLGTSFNMEHLFDLYVSESVYEGLNELIAVPADHEQRGPIAMGPHCVSTTKATSHSVLHTD